MEILFCDICNESVPAPDLTSGKAFRRGGRVVCAACDTAMSLHRGDAGGAAGDGPGAARPAATPAPATAPAAGGARPEPAGAPAAPARSGGGGAMGALVGLVAVIFAAVGFSLLLERLDEMEDGARQAREGLRSELGQVRRQQEQLLGSLDLRIAESEARADEARKALLADVAALGEALRGELSGHGERTDAVARDLQALGESLDQRDEAAAEALADLGRQVIDLENDIRFYSDRVVELEETLRLLASRPVAISGGPAAAGGAEGADTAPPWQGLVTDLAHANPGIRLDAVYALGETRDQRVVPHLVPMLDDDDLFVRMATARVLMDLDARLAVPNLIDTLEDTSSAVREAAMVALRQITSQDFGFEPLASDPERAKKVKSWRDWWKKSGDDFLTSTS